ncbi:MAG: hypothetical protein EAZ65_05780 [Verrucomicrobia bacterium]|nr:MAG: hypothetical protein EAZ84_01325 [Verrucomicrobiota bacterium]TAE87812.1 MAG: hypothetical protein EAZ82_06245 [Verrucomicrobiota bacterium]TAF25555.1 MAG: hypothetical protein EAZ71_07170 [Verrucomicrobiota bacterium]TAF41378.1 MAG: hypothetical protein EAZ65_05780 [Verrucomicrobiota bacterium]
MQRIVEPEMMDQLPPDDPEVLRSRRDLRVINFLMGNERWIARQVGHLPMAREKGVLEIGAGEGDLLRRLAKEYPAIPLAGCDLAPRPQGLPGQIAWHRHDVFELRDGVSGGILVANLFLHHFEAPQLMRFRELMRNFEVICINEPLRGEATLVNARVMLPFVGRVTRHDMLVSIRAGFRLGELPALLGLDSAAWRIREESDWRGGLRVLACRA